MSTTAPDIRPGPAQTAGAEEPMTPQQAERLRHLAEEAFELDAFARHLTREEAARRIAVLEAKLRLLGEPPHTL
jgi:hypothetical protein